MTEQEVAQEIKRLLEEHPFLSIHPSRTPEKWAALVVKQGGCPCVPGRAKCPCDEVMADIAEKGYCRCQLFVNEKWMQWYKQYLRGGRGVAKRKSLKAGAETQADPQQAPQAQQ